MANGYVQLPGGYDAATGQQPQQQTQPQQQFAPQPQLTLLGQPTQQAQMPQPMLQDPPSPLSMVPPNMPRLPWMQQQQMQQSQSPQQMQQAQAPVPQQQFQVPAGVDLNARAYGANIPQELQGRTVGEIIGIANGLRQVHLSTLQQPQQPQQPSQGYQQAAPPAPQQQAPAGQPAAFDWRNPEAGIGRVVAEQLRGFEQRILPALQPVIQQGQTAAVQSARNLAAAEIPNYAQIEPLILQRLQGIDPAALSNPETWRVAARVAIGDLALHGQRQQMGLATQTPQQPGMYPTQQVGPGQNPAPNLNSFFSETPMQGGPGPSGPPQLTQQQAAAANAMGMSLTDYAAWNAGSASPQAQPFGGRR